MVAIGRIVAVLCIQAVAWAAVAAEGPVPILDMDASEVAELLFRSGIIKKASTIELSNDGAALVDFIRWYDAMPPIARFIEENNPLACKAWATAAHWMEKKQQILSLDMYAAEPSSFLQWYVTRFR